MIVSAALGTPMRPSRAANSPSFITPSPIRFGSSVWCTIEGVEVARIDEGAPHHLRVDHALRAVAERDRAGRLEQADLGHLFAVAALGQRRHRMDMDDRGVARAAHDEIDDRRVVDRRIGVGLADDGGDAAGRRRAGSPTRRSRGGLRPARPRRRACRPARAPPPCRGSRSPRCLPARPTHGFRASPRARRRRRAADRRESRDRATDR